MLRGELDCVTSSGFVDGWAFDDTAPTKPLTLAVRAEGEEVARGIANRFRADLADAEVATGWCSFRFRLNGPIGRLRRRPSELQDLATARTIARSQGLRLAEDAEYPLRTVEAVVAADPTLVTAISQLRGCGRIFDTLIEAKGLETFIRATYIYVLGRPADPTGLDHYSAMIKGGELKPFGLLEALADSDEFRSTSRLLLAPTEPGFIFSAL